MNWEQIQVAWTPDFPGTLDIPPRTNMIDATNIREVYKCDMALYRECREVEKALMKHITTSVESKDIVFQKINTLSL